MYRTEFYRTTDIETIGFFIKSYPFAVIAPDGDAAGRFLYLPLVHDETAGPARRLFGHVDNENPLLRCLDARCVHAIFQGPNGYISPAYYVTRQLPTWNYSVVHVSGLSRLVTDEAAKLAYMSAMADALETGQTEPFRLDQGDARIVGLVRQITFFTLELHAAEATFKYSQDKSRDDVLAAKTNLLRTIDERHRTVLSRIVG